MQIHLDFHHNWGPAGDSWGAAGDHKFLEKAELGSATSLNPAQGASLPINKAKSWGQRTGGTGAVAKRAKLATERLANLT